MDVSIPLGTIFSALKEKVEKFLLLETYEESHRKYSERCGFLNKWDEIGHDLEISCLFPSIVDNGRVLVPRLAIRHQNNTKTIDKLVLRIEAQSGYVIYQECIEILRLSSVPIVKSLPSVPLREFFISDIGIFQSIDKFEIYINELVLDGEEADVNPVKPAYFILLNTIDLMNDRFKKRWGAYWNLREIDKAIVNIRHMWYRRLLVPKVFYAREEDIPLRDRIKQIFRVFVGAPVYWIFFNQFMCRLYFWVPIFLHLKKFRVDEIEELSYSNKNDA